MSDGNQTNCDHVYTLSPPYKVSGENIQGKWVTCMVVEGSCEKCGEMTWKRVNEESHE